MAGSGKGKIVDRGWKYPKIFVYIPKEVASDTSFPFEIGEDVTVRIKGERLIIEKRKRKSLAKRT
jgi:antitoxin component of MazEF toxin-antitoxin module